MGKRAPILYIAAALLLSVMTVSCSKPGTEGSGALDDDTKYYVNMFAANLMGGWYLWADEISDALSSWNESDDPVEKVLQARYKDSDGEDIDRWTVLTDDYEAFRESVNGSSLTLGMRVLFAYSGEDRGHVYAIVTFVYDGSPAYRAGFRRGTVITMINGELMDPSNYVYLAEESIYGTQESVFTLLDGTDVALTPVDMYLDPVVMSKTFETSSGSKVGYLLYNAFTIDSAERLVSICDDLKSEGISELILDLRYNGGGYVITENALASMLAPEDAVKRGDVYEKNIYNDLLGGDDDENDTLFSTSYSFTSGEKDYCFDTSDSNLGISRLYVITTGSTASASESLICGLKPYMDVVTVGKKTYGKFCSGSLVSAESWYGSVKDSLGDTESGKGRKHAAGWGMYIMVARYADRYGVTLSMPDGISADRDADDNPLDGHELGDPEESMLKVALGLTGYTKEAACAVSSVSKVPDILEMNPEPAGFGTRIIQ